jgi:hypothetical protein
MFKNTGSDNNQRAVLTQSFNQRAELAASEEIEDLTLSSNKRLNRALLTLSSNQKANLTPAEFFVDPIF